MQPTFTSVVPDSITAEYSTDQTWWFRIEDHEDDPITATLTAKQGGTAVTPATIGLSLSEDKSTKVPYTHKLIFNHATF